MLVAQLRGVEFVCGDGEHEEPTDSEAFEALEDVALALGYSSQWDYNHACRTNPDEVRKRLAAL